MGKDSESQPPSPSKKNSKHGPSLITQTQLRNQRGPAPCTISPVQKNSS